MNHSFRRFVSQSNRGMGLESDLNETNEYYLVNDIAIIYKKPTPVTINRVNYKSRTDAVISEAHFNTPSTTDYNGLYKGKYIDFEAKETKLKLFPLSNIHKHQVEHLRRIIKHGGIAFLIVRFVLTDDIYFLDGKDFFAFLEKNDRKSIPQSYFEENGYKIKVKFNPRIDYLKIVDEIYFKGEAL